MEVNGYRVSHVLYADDLVIFAKNECRLQERLSALSGAGMELNAQKSKDLTLVKDNKRKYLILKERAYKMGFADNSTDLGLKFTWKGRVAPNSTKRLEDFLRGSEKFLLGTSEAASTTALPSGVCGTEASP